jgi:phospholipid/cholesterol/gamma-HCH transport system substrate-binding protein
MTRKNKVSSSFLIGIFVLIGFAIFIGVIIWLGETQFMKKTKYFSTYFEASVEGLEKGSSVKYLGVPIGTVDHVGVAPDGKLVEVIMQIEADIEISEKLRVKAEFAGIAGGKFLQLSFPVSEDMLNSYPKLTFKPKYTLIKSAPSGIKEIEIAMREVMNNLRLLEVSKISNETIRFLNSASEFFNNEELYNIISKFNDASLKLDNILYKADTSDFIENIDYTSRKLLQTSDELVSFGIKLNTQLEELMLTQKVENAFAQYDSTMTNTRKIINVLGFRVEDILFTLNETMLELQSTNKQLKKTLKAFTENPSQLLFSEPPPEER